jgi:two-component system CheB/CheR fusion protein
MSAKTIRKVLIIEDEVDMTVFKRGLELEGFEIDAYSDPVDALNSFAANKYDLLLADIKMPNMSGFELYREIKKVDTRIKVAFITAFEIHRTEFEKPFPDIDVKLFIKKPISIEEVVKVIREEFPKLYDTDA